MSQPYSLRVQTLKRQQGLSLIELMIAMTLGLILLAGVVQIFLSSKQTYSTVMGTSQLLDNGRLATHFISNSVTKAGYWGDVSFTREYGTDSGLEVVHTGTSNTPYADKYIGRFGVNEYLSGSNDDATDANVVDGTDEIWIRFNGNDGSPMTNCAGANILATQVAIERYYLSEPVGSETIGSLVCETTVMTLDQATGTLSVPASPVISTQSLISGVENMQVLYSQRDVGDTQARYFAADDVTDWRLVEGIRVALLVASSDQVTSVSRSSGYKLLDVTTSAPTDKRSRRVFERMMAVRNVNLNIFLDI